MEKNIREEYLLLTAKHNLPDFKKIDNEFEISSIESTTFLLRRVRRRMNDKLVFFCRIIEGILYPNSPSVTNMQEIKFFTEQDKDNMIVTYKKMMMYERRGLELDIRPNDKEEVLLIKELFNEWPEFSRKMIHVAAILRQGWAEKVIIGKGEAYFG